MKKLICFFLAVGALLCLQACGCDDGEDADLIFINDSDTVITAVLVDFEDHSTVTQHADSSPLKRGESFGFETGKYPVTVVVYAESSERIGQKELGQVTVNEAPAAGERWYVTVLDSDNGLTFTIDISRPKGV